MRSDSENFVQLLRLLKFKNHEQPPPGYFENFPGQVISRIRAGERAADPNVLQLLLMEMPWLRRLWAELESRPALTGMLGAAACTLLLVGMLYPGRQDLRPDQFSPGAAAVMVSTPPERGHGGLSIAQGTAADLFETNIFGGPSGGSLVGQPVKFSLQGN